MQQTLVKLRVNNLTFSILSSLKLNFSTTVLGTTWLRTIISRAYAGNNKKIVTFTYSCLYAFGNC